MIQPCAVEYLLALTDPQMNMLILFVWRNGMGIRPYYVLCQPGCRFLKSGAKCGRGARLPVRRQSAQNQELFVSSDN